MAKLTIIGMASFLSESGDDLFKYMSLPDGIDSETVKDNILLRGAEYECLYADPYFFQNAIGVWSRKWNRTFDKWIKLLQIDYNPLENYDRKESWTDDNTGTVSRDGQIKSELNDTVSTKDTISESATAHGTDTNDVTGSSVTENKVSAFDSSDYQNESKNIGNTKTGSTSSTSQNTSNSRSDNSDTVGTHNNSETSTELTTNDLHNVREGRAHGNIGVMSSQDMFKQELEVAYWNLTEQITDIFLREFVIPLFY